MSENELNDTFIYIIRVAQDDISVRETLLRILSLDADIRQRAILNLVKELKQNNAPKDFIEAIAYLSDNAIADKTLETIKAM